LCSFGNILLTDGSARTTLARVRDRSTFFAVTSQAMLSARRVSSNPGNNRPLPQNLWDAIERSG
jgi:hypothetical protein